MVVTIDYSNGGNAVLSRWRRSRVGSVKSLCNQVFRVVDFPSILTVYGAPVNFRGMP